MKIGKSTKGNADKAVKGAGAPKANAHKRTAVTVFISVVAFLMILLVFTLARKAEKTVAVIMTANTLYKNQQITDVDTQLVKYDMLQGEYEKYAVLNRDGSAVKRLILWDDRAQVKGYFMANQVGAERLLEKSDLVKSKIDNSDAVMYAYPGKDLVKLTLGTSDLTAFKSYLKPGDRINLECSYTVAVKTADTAQTTTGDAGADSVPISSIGWSGAGSTLEQFDTDVVFGNIQIADIRNSTGDSVLDLMMQYNDMGILQQAKLDTDKNYQKKLEPATLILALTPAEKRRYKKFLAKNGVTFYISIPQRIE